MNIHEFARKPGAHESLVEFGALTLRAYIALLQQQSLMVGEHAVLAGLSSDVIRLILRAIDQGIGDPVSEPNPPAPAWLSQLWDGEPTGG
jgi:hypothetical protein